MPYKMVELMHKIFFISFLIPALFFSGCNKTGTDKKSSSQEQTAEVSTAPAETVVEEPQPIESFSRGTIITKTASLHLFGRDRKMHRIISLNQGNSLEAVYLNGKADEFQDTENLNELFYHVIYDSIDYWIYQEDFFLESVGAVVIERCPLFKDQNLSIPADENKSLGFGTFVAERKGSGDSSVEISFYDRNRKTKCSYYADDRFISTSIDDIEVLKIVEQLKVTKRAVPRNELFKRAAKFNPREKVKAALKAQQTEYVENNYEDVLKALPKAKYGVNIPELMTVDQSKDPFN